MLFKTRGIVLSHIKFKESSIITSIFTEQFGLQSYIINSIRSKKSKNKISYFQPLTLLDLVVYKNTKKDIQRISEYRANTTYADIPFNPRKSTIAIFLSEILAKTLSTEESQLETFNFLHSALSYFDLAPDQELTNFHLQFLLHLSQHLGVYANAKEIMAQVELKTGLNGIEQAKCIEALQTLQRLHYTEFHPLTLSDRRMVFNCLISFLQSQFISLQNIKSIDVIRELNA